MSIRLSNLPLAADSVVPSGFFPVADLTDMNLTEGMGRTLNIPVSGIYDISINKNIISKTNSYNLSKHDYKSTILFYNSSDVELVVLPNNIERINPGFNVNIVRNNTGNVHVVPSGSVQIYSDTGFYLKTKYSLVTLTKITEDNWILQGDLTDTPNDGGASPVIPAFSVSGAGTSNYNGKYCLIGIWQEHNLYKHSTENLYIYFQVGIWWIGPDKNLYEENSNGYYITNHTGQLTPPENGWESYPPERGSPPILESAMC